MSRLFLFSIGGTGSRVVRSLVHLLAASVRLQDAAGKPLTLVPILIDTDATNNDTLSCVRLLELYQEIHAERRDDGSGGFFSTPIRRLRDFAKDEKGNLSPTFRTSSQTVENVTFGQFIDFVKTPDQATKDMLRLLYSEENFHEALTGGFLGNPNVGSVVLSAFKDSSDFKLFAKEFTAGDRIFVINSIFGGTGAAGLPWLVKHLRSLAQQEGSAAAIRIASIGALTVLPYFKLTSDNESRIDSNSFIMKTKAALSYYHRHLTQLNSLYYIADSVQPTYDNHESGSEQSNKAHIVELIGALAIFNFAATPEQAAVADETKCFEFALENDDKRLDFYSLGKIAGNMIDGPLTQMQILSLLNRKHFLALSNQVWLGKDLSKGFFKSEAYGRTVDTYLRTFYEVWISQLAENTRAFAPFDLHVTGENMTRLLTNRNAASSSWRTIIFGAKVSAESFDMQANTIKDNLGSKPNTLFRFLEISWRATKPLSEKLLKSLAGE